MKAIIEKTENGIEVVFRPGVRKTFVFQTPDDALDFVRKRFGDESTDGPDKQETTG